MTLILPYNERIYVFFLTLENTGQWEPVFSHILCSPNVQQHQKYSSELLLRNYYLQWQDTPWIHNMAKHWLEKKYYIIRITPKSWKTPICEIHCHYSRISKKSLNRQASLRNHSFGWFWNYSGITGNPCVPPTFHWTKIPGLTTSWDIWWKIACCL